MYQTSDWSSCSGPPLAAYAQQPGKLPIIGFLGAGTASVARERIVAFEQRLQELGWIRNRTVIIEYRWAEDHLERSPDIIAEFVRDKVDVIVKHATANIIAAKKTTADIPYRCRRLTLSARDWLQAWRGRAATLQVSQLSRPT